MNITCLKLLTLHFFQITHFLNLVRSIYRELPNHMDNMFKPRPPPQVNDLSELDVESLLQMTYISTEILCKKGELAEGSGVNESVSISFTTG